ncbi:glutathione-disulfide reductase [Parvibaculum sp.]|jgi:glutathione reductase (NADPH)|uniref:glutathione-disulfide reductase n=1 Tax=Parvibaculum sp. TaxID=2024848 RepID=UPI000C61427F|nr:glutathione-disulfide reductase [Parvibaculum sp.]MAM94640.1 glutathione-disulfide reductase [Parvibaculum sp.]HCX69522.1 glutathione-disulfide reductase [Rhodobiaceae bacterium]|tara:strand:+ start:2516 stop:3898 length:1383 start_codon:yes stop_codon:yes gene_type:complete
MAEYDYDLFVIGAGSGGVRAARIAANYGAKVAVAEEYRVGGTCVIRGCVPKKLFVYASHFSDDFEDAAGFGWTVGETKFDWKTLVSRKDKEIDRLNGIYIRNLEKAGVEIIDGRATVKDAHTIQIDGHEREITAERILVAVGATPFLPDIPGIEHAITSNEAFHLEELPRRVVVVGGGYIAVEFAGIFNGLGVETMQLYRGPLFMRGFDDDLRDLLSEEMTKKGIDLRMNSDIVSIEKKDGELHLTLNDGDTISTDCVMYATGRVPNTKGLGLEEAGVKLGMAGEVVVDEYSQSSVESIYAVGDVTDRANLTPVAIREGHAFADTVYGGKDVKVDHSIIPTAIFSQPEMGTVGLTEAQAREQYDEVDIYKTAFRALKNTLSDSQERTFMKLIVDARSDKVLGVHIMGSGAGEVIQAIGIAVTMGATKAQFDATIAVHPTAAEELVTMKEKWQAPVIKAAD